MTAADTQEAMRAYAKVCNLRLRFLFLFVGVMGCLFPGFTVHVLFEALGLQPGPDTLEAVTERMSKSSS
jgi:hypothetical protein